MKKIFQLLILGFIIEFLASCCECEDPEFYNFTHDSIEINVIDNSGPTATVVFDGQVPAKAYGIRMEVLADIDFEGISCRFSFSRKLMAFDCDCPPEIDLEALDSITSIQVFTTNPFDDEHGAGSDVSEFFRFTDGYGFQKLDEEFPTYPEIYSDHVPEKIPCLSGDLLLMFEPDFPGIHQFTVQVNLSDGRKLEMTTIELELI